MAQMSNTQKTSSQMSPHTGDGSSGSHRSPLDVFNITVSPAGSGLHQLEMPFGRDSPSSQKPFGGDLGNLGREDDDQFMMDDDWGIRIDEDGNVVLADEPQLPQLPPFHSDPAVPGAKQNVPAQGAPEAENEMMLEIGDDILPEAEAFSQLRHSNEEVQKSSSSATAPIRKQHRKPFIVADERTMLSSAEIREWSRAYAERSAAARKPARRPTQAQARQTAYDLTFGFGIGHVGTPTGIPGLVHPLAQYFAGAALERSILGFTLNRTADDDDESQPPRGHRRTSAEAFGDDDEGTPTRRTRPRLTGTPQIGRAAAEEHHDAQILPQNDDMGMLDPEQDLEHGREAPGSAQRSDISAPWNRPGSVPGSSTRGGSAAKVSGLGRQVSASPLHLRGTGLPAIERLSSDLNIAFGSDPLGPNDHSSVLGAHDQQQVGTTSQLAQAALDQEGQRFLGYVGAAAKTRGEARDDGRNWVEFDSLFDEPDATRVVVTQAFFHVLTLATRDDIKVEQDDALTKPFGPIRLGVLAGDDEEGGEFEEVVGGDVAV
jgi:meiotic recombination protein REC8